MTFQFLPCQDRLDDRYERRDERYERRDERPRDDRRDGRIYARGAADDGYWRPELRTHGMNMNELCRLCQLFRVHHRHTPRNEWLEVLQRRWFFEVDFSRLET